MKDFYYQERKMAARRIRQIRQKEKDDGLATYAQRRNGERYNFLLQGLQGTLDYARRLPSNLVVDIGAGVTRAIKEISEEEMAKDLKFKATILGFYMINSKLFYEKSRLYKKLVDELKKQGKEAPRRIGNKYLIEQNLGLKNTHITSAETLRPFADESVAVLLSVYSVNYSASLRLVAESIDRVLVPGGVFKGFFPFRKEDTSLEAETAYPFVVALAEKGYDIVCAEGDQLDNGYYEGHGIVLAVKPGGGQPVTARELFCKDLESIARKKPLK